MVWFEKKMPARKGLACSQATADFESQLKLFGSGLCRFFLHAFEMTQNFTNCPRATLFRYKPQELIFTNHVLSQPRTNETVCETEITPSFALSGAIGTVNEMFQYFFQIIL